MKTREGLVMVDHKLTRFLNKRQNQPLLSLLRSDTGRRFRNEVRNALLNQAEQASKLIRTTEDSRLGYGGLDERQQAVIRNLLYQELDPFSSYLSQDRITDVLKHAFLQGVKTQYRRWGVVVKASVSFDLQNQNYINSLRDRANYLLTRSNLDDTTRDDLVSLIGRGAADGLTYDEIGSLINQDFPDIAEYRSDMIARTELANAMGDGNLAAMQENGVRTKHWVTAGGDPCPECVDNEEDGSIAVGEDFSSGDDSEPAHPNCECYVEADEVDLESIDLWGGE